MFACTGWRRRAHNPFVATGPPAPQSAGRRRRPPMTRRPVAQRRAVAHKHAAGGCRAARLAVRLRHSAPAAPAGRLKLTCLTAGQLVPPPPPLSLTHCRRRNSGQWSVVAPMRWIARGWARGAPARAQWHTLFTPSKRPVPVRGGVTAAKTKDDLMRNGQQAITDYYCVLHAHYCVLGLCTQQGGIVNCWYCEHESMLNEHGYSMCF